MSETSRHRDRFTKYTKGMGIDIGYGGAPINDTAITMDMQSMYVDYKGKPQNLYGDARNLYWFKDGVLDYLYCLPAKTGIRTPHGIQPIEDIKIGDQVMSSMGVWRYVQSIHKKRYDGNLINLTIP